MTKLILWAILGWTIGTILGIINPFIYIPPAPEETNAISDARVERVYAKLRCGEELGIPTSTLYAKDGKLKTASFDAGWYWYTNGNESVTIIGFCYDNILP